MAKGIRLGVMRGKLGNEVLYKITNSNNKVQQGARVYTANVSNPRTVRQVSQRMKMAPAVNFYRALVNILDHSWQGVRYGGRSHAEFMKHALKMAVGFPYVTQGDLTPFPGEYQISTGSLSPVGVSFNEDGYSINTSLLMGSVIESENPTIGDVSSMLLQANPQLQSGDQLTFIGVYAISSDTNDLASDWKEAGFIYSMGRFIIDQTNTATINEWEASQGFANLNSIRVNGNFILTVAGSNAKKLVAAACIVSRPPRTEGGAWLRSNSKLACSAEYLDIMLGDDAYQLAIDSYTNATATIQSDWYLNNGNGQSSTAAGSGATLSAGSVTLAGTTFNGAFFNNRNQSKLIVGPLSNNQRAVYAYVSPNSIRAQGTFTQDAVQGSGNSYVLLSTVRNYLPNLVVDGSSTGGSTSSPGDDERP